MHIILGIIGLATAAYFMVMRARNAAQITHELLDVADDVRAAARRFGFRRRTNLHPVEGIEDPSVAISGLATAFIALDDLPTLEARKALDIALRKHLRLDAEGATEIAVLGQWLMESCGSAQAAVPRLSRQLYAVDKGSSFEQLMAVIKDVQAVTSTALSHRQTDALMDIKKAFRIK